MPIREGRLFERGRLFEEIRFTAEFYHGKETTELLLYMPYNEKKACLKFDQM